MRITYYFFMGFYLHGAEYAHLLHEFYFMHAYAACIHMTDDAPRLEMNEKAYDFGIFNRSTHEHVFKFKIPAATLIIQNPRRVRLHRNTPFWKGRPRRRGEIKVTLNAGSRKGKSRNI